MALETAVAEIIASWDRGALARGEVVARFVDLLTPTNVAEAVAAVPDAWRVEFVDRLLSLGAPGPLAHIGGAPSAAFEAEIRPAIRAWLLRRG